MSDPSRQRLIRAVRLLPGVKFNRGEFEAVSPKEETKAEQATGALSDADQRLTDELTAAAAEIRRLKSELRDRESDIAAALAAEKAARAESAAMSAGLAAERDRLAKESAEAARQAKEAAAKQGREEGYALGYKEGTSRADTEQRTIYKDKFDSIVALVEGVSSSLAEEREKLTLSISPQLIRLWEMMLRRLLYTCVSLDPDAVKRTLIEVLARVSDREKIIVYLNPEDISTVESTRDELMDSLRGIKHFEFMADEHVDRGSCLVETNMGIYDARWRTQLEQISVEVQGLLNEAAVVDDSADS